MTGVGLFVQQSLRTKEAPMIVVVTVLPRAVTRAVASRAMFCNDESKSIAKNDSYT